MSNSKIRFCLERQLSNLFIEKLNLSYQACAMQHALTFIENNNERVSTIIKI